MSTFHHFGVPTNVEQDGETYIEGAKVFVTDAEIHPYRVEFLRFELGDKILIAKFGVGAVVLQMVLELGRTRSIHVARVPFAAERRHGIRTPVDKDSEFAVAIPLGCLEIAHRFPVGLERTLPGDLVDG